MLAERPERKENFQKLTFGSLQRDTGLYLLSLRDFFYLHGIKHLLGPIDHLAYKTADTGHFDYCLSCLEPICVRSHFVTMDNRKLATLELYKPINCEGLGETKLLELMEPRPEKVGKDFIGLEHAEIYHRNLAKIQKELEAQGVNYQVQKNPSHRTIVFPISRAGQEIKFTDRPLGEIIKKKT